MKTTGKKGLILLALIALCSACKKDNNTPSTGNNGGSQSTDGTILSKVDYWTIATNQAQTIRELVLDSKNEISGLKTYTTAGAALDAYTSVEKNTDGKIIKISGTRASSGTALTWTFEYGSNGKIAKRTQTVGSTVFLVKYSYDDNKRLLKVENLNSTGTTVTNRTTYTYTGNDDNPVSYLQENFNPATASTNTTLTYDDKKNPYQAANEILYYMDMGEFYTKNVTKQVTDDGTSVTFKYTYNASGYALSKEGSSGSGLKFTLVK